MKKMYFLLVLMLVLWLPGEAQDFNVGVMMATGSAKKNTTGAIQLSDSTFTIDIDGIRTQWNVISRTEVELYITDGTATDKVMITPAKGELKGFAYSHILVRVKDKRFGGGEVFYYCQQRKD